MNDEPIDPEARRLAVLREHMWDVLAQEAGGTCPLVSELAPKILRDLDEIDRQAGIERQPPLAEVARYRASIVRLIEAVSDREDIDEALAKAEADVKRLTSELAEAVKAIPSPRMFTRTDEFTD